MNKKGFTLSELLIVVAIVAVLVLVSIPVFASQTERSAESADIDNMRAAKSAASAQLISGYDLDGNILGINGYTCYFDAQSGMLTKEVPSGYGRGTETDGGCEDTYMVVNPTSSIPQIIYTSKTNVEDMYLSIFLNSEGTIKLSWNNNSTDKSLTDNESTNDSATEEEIEEGYIPPEGYLPYIMTSSNRNMVNYKSSSYSAESLFEYDGEKYYFKGYDDNCLNGYSGIIKIPESVSYISDNAFNTCSSVTGFSITNNENYSTLNSGKILVDNNKSKIIKVTNKQGNFTIPSNIKEIGAYAFKGASMSLKTMNVPDSVTYIGEGAFYGLRYLQRVTIPGSVKEIKKNTFYNPFNSIILTISEGVETIESEGIVACGLKLTLPSTIKHLESDSIKLYKSSCVFTCTYNGVTYTSIDELVEAVNN